MRARSAAFIPFVAILVGCDDSSSPRSGGPVQISVEQSLTSQTSAAGTFQMSGSFVDTGATNEELTFGGPLDRSPVPVTFVRTLTGAQGTMVLRGSASITFTSPTVGILDGSWTVESTTGRYATMSGTGSLTGRADFGTTPPSASLTYSGSLAQK